MDFDNVSVIVPVLNEEKYIKECLDSLLNQDYPKENLEIILVDGNSSDKTAEIIKKYTGKYNFIKLINNPQKTVQYAMNLGIKNSSGKYIVRMDAHAAYSNDYISECRDVHFRPLAAPERGDQSVQEPVRVVRAEAERGFHLGERVAAGAVLRHGKRGIDGQRRDERVFPGRGRSAEQADREIGVRRCPRREIVRHLGGRGIDPF